MADGNIIAPGGVSTSYCYVRGWIHSVTYPSRDYAQITIGVNSVWHWLDGWQGATFDLYWWSDTQGWVDYFPNGHWWGPANLTPSAEASSGTGTTGTLTHTDNWSRIVGSNRNCKYRAVLTINGHQSIVDFDTTIAEIPQYTITYYKNDGTNTSTSAKKTYGDTYTIAANWTSHQLNNTVVTGYTVSYNLNGGTSTKPSNQTSTRTRKYAANGWNTKADGSGTNYAVGYKYTSNAALTLYEKWSLTYTNNAITLPAAPTRPGYTFNGWYTAASGGTKAGDAGASYTPSSNQTLYAQWTAQSQTVTFNANGGTTPTASKTVTYDQTYGALPIPTRPGYEFLGWFTSLDGGMEVTSDTVVKITAAQTLYAHWKVMGAVFAHDGDQWQRALCYLSTDDGWKHALPYVYTSDGWKLTIF